VKICLPVISSNNSPTLVELVRHLSYAAQVAEALAALRNVSLTGEDRVTFGELLKMAREESHIMAVLSTILRLTNQSRDDSVVAKRARERQPTGRRPWEPLDKAQDGLDS
jgi:hypothetical protein